MVGSKLARAPLCTCSGLLVLLLISVALGFWHLLPSIYSGESPAGRPNALPWKWVRCPPIMNGGRHGSMEVVGRCVAVGGPPRRHGSMEVVGSCVAVGGTPLCLEGGVEGGVEERRQPSADP